MWRYDGSYTFPTEDRFGFFPGIMAGWRVSEESWFQTAAPFFDNLKLRASYGQVGAEPYKGGSIAEFQYLSLYGFTTYVIDGQLVRGLNENVLPNPTFTWEVQNSTNFGIEMGFLNNRLNFEFDYFMNKRSKGLFTQEGSIPASAGISNILPPVNYAELENKGWEFTLGWNDQVGEFRYSVSINGGYARNKILKWNEPAGVPEHQRSTGKPFGSNGSSYLVYLYDGVFATQKDIDENDIDYSDVGGTQLRPGDMKFKDVSGPDGVPDGKISSLDLVRLDKTRDPRFTGGLNISLQWRNFDLSLLFQGATGGLLFVRTESGDIGNYLKWDFDHRWTIENPSSVYPRIASRDNTYYTGGAGGNNDYRLKSTNYVRFKNFELGYNVPASLLNRVGLNNLRIYASGINLITWDELGIFDPEAIVGNGQYYPQSRVLNFGVNLSF